MKSYVVELDLRSGKVEIEYNDALLEQIRKIHGMSPSDPVDDDMIVSYLKGEIQSALSKVEAKKDG